MPESLELPGYFHHIQSIQNLIDQERAALHARPSIEAPPSRDFLPMGGSEATRGGGLL
jgi:hypothetical protein